MNIFKLSFKNIFHKPVGTILSIVLLTLAVGIISILIHVNSSIQNQMNNNLKGVDMVVGAKGSPLQLILSSVYHVDSPTGNISLADANSITNNRMVKNSTKLSFGDNFKGFKIVGTEKNFLELYNCKFENGRVWEKSLEAVVGKKAAEILGILKSGTAKVRVQINEEKSRKIAMDYDNYEVFVSDAGQSEKVVKKEIIKEILNDDERNKTNLKQTNNKK